MCPIARRRTVLHIMKEGNAGGEEAETNRGAGIESTAWRRQGEEGGGLEGSKTKKKKKRKAGSEFEAATKRKEDARESLMSEKDDERRAENEMKS